MTPQAKRVAGGVTGRWGVSVVSVPLWQAVFRQTLATVPIPAHVDLNAFGFVPNPARPNYQASMELLGKRSEQINLVVFCAGSLVLRISLGSLVPEKAQNAIDGLLFAMREADRLAQEAEVKRGGLSFDAYTQGIIAELEPVIAKAESLDTVDRPAVMNALGEYLIRRGDNLLRGTNGLFH